MADRAACLEFNLHFKFPSNLNIYFSVKTCTLKREHCDIIVDVKVDARFLAAAYCYTNSVRQSGLEPTACDATRFGSVGDFGLVKLHHVVIFIM